MYITYIANDAQKVALHCSRLFFKYYLLFIGPKRAQKRKNLYVTKLELTSKSIGLTH